MHTHSLPGVVAEPHFSVYEATRQQITIQPGERFIVDTGRTGRDGDIVEVDLGGVRAIAQLDSDDLGRFVKRPHKAREYIFEIVGVVERI